MRKLIISLVLLLSLSGIAVAQKYQGSVSVNGTFIGFGANTSHGVRFEKDYIGAGVDAGVWTLLFLAREWYSVYADYQHYFPIKGSSSFFLQAAPGTCWTEFSVIGNSSAPDSDNPPERGIRAYARLGLGFDWQWKACGLSVSLQNALFAPKLGNPEPGSEAYWIPSLQLTFHW